MIGAKKPYRDPRSTQTSEQQGLRKAMRLMMKAAEPDATEDDLAEAERQIRRYRHQTRRAAVTAALRRRNAPSVPPIESQFYPVYRSNMRARLLGPRLVSPGVRFSLRRLATAPLIEPHRRERLLFLGAIIALCALTYLVGLIVFSVPFAAETFPVDCH
jgi:hypothetical protein